MLITYLGFYRARKAQGLADQYLPYVAPLTPYAPVVSLICGCTALVFVGFDVFSPFSIRGFITSYFALLWAAVMFGVGRFLVWKRGGKMGFIAAKDADLLSGKDEIDEECRHWEEGGIEEVEKARLAKMSVGRRTWEKMW
ncbi:Lysine-specific permease like protein [Verticillium longisporum]|nr:Lysine-specific permease like protein [Verticillium longisporum]